MRLVVPCIAAMLALPAMAQAADVYRCAMPDGKVEFRSSPCPSGAKESKTATSSAPRDQDEIAAAALAESPIVRQANAAIAAALNEGDIAKAERLAVTKEQWAMVNAAKAAKQARDNDAKARVIAAQTQQNKRCRDAAETIIRQEAWLQSVSEAVRQSAKNEILIQRQRMTDYGC